MVVIHWSDAINGPIVKLDGPLCGVLYKEDHGYIVPWSGTDPYANLNSSTCSKEENDWIVLGDQNNEDLNKWQGHIHNGQFRTQKPKKKIGTERI